MSRVVFEDTPATTTQQALRVEHGVRLVTADEEGTGVGALPEGVYGFTYSPGLPNAPLFTVRRYRSFELHKVRGGEVFLVGFVPASTAVEVAGAASEVTVVVRPEPDADATTLVAVPYSRIRQHRQHAAPNQGGATLTIVPA